MIIRMQRSVVQGAIASTRSHYPRIKLYRITEHSLTFGSYIAHANNMATKSTTKHFKISSYDILIILAFLIPMTMSDSSVPPTAATTPTSFMPSLLLSTINSSIPTSMTAPVSEQPMGKSPVESGGTADEESDLHPPTWMSSSRPVNIITQFLQYVAAIEKNQKTCEKGTWAVTLPIGAVSYGPERYMDQAKKAVSTANMLTRIWQSKSLTELHKNEDFFYNVVVSNVENDPKIFAFGNCYDYMEFLNYTLYCPFAYREPDGIINVKDLSVEYRYLSNASEWFYQARMKVDQVLRTRDKSQARFTWRYNDTMHGEQVDDDTIMVHYEDGHWSAPYFDCGGGNIWMMTYTVPFLGRMPNGTYYFKGTSGLDIDLRAIDINQCEGDNKTNISKEENFFSGTDKCDNYSQQCVFIENMGFRRGSYHCVCKKGFYFPDTDAAVKYYNGTFLEEQYDAKMAEKENEYDELICLPCGEGCEECIDGRSCLFPYNWPLRTTFLVIQCLTIVGMVPLFVFTIQFSDVKVVKAASPVLLRIIIIGALFLYCLALVGYLEPSVTKCTLMQWFKEVGFSTLYGALLLKTWRISVVFRVRSAARVRITDVDLIKRLGLIIAVSVFYLIVRSVVSPPTVEMISSVSGLKAYQCSYDWWDYAANIAELLLLLWGIRLCYVVRKAPSEFNESRFISWAIYNETLLSLFLCVATFFLQDLANPDVLYLIWFFYSQLTTTVVVVLLFGSKVYLVLHGKGDKTDNRMKTGTTGTTGNMRQRTWEATNSLSSQGLCVKHEEKPLNQVDIQDELKRLYTQLEMLKTRNMVVGNPHLTQKLTAMAEAARATEQMLIDSTEHELSCASNGVAEVTYTVNNGRTSTASTKGDWI